MITGSHICFFFTHKLQTIKTIVPGQFKWVCKRSAFGYISRSKPDYTLCQCIFRIQFSLTPHFPLLIVCGNVSYFCSSPDSLLQLVIRVPADTVLSRSNTKNRIGHPNFSVLSPCRRIWFHYSVCTFHRLFPKSFRIERSNTDQT